MNYDTELELIFHKLDGLFFQDFFNELMVYDTQGFCPVRQKLDGGNDGFVPTTGTYYQVYAPESVTSATINTALSKLIDDFEKLVDKWHYLIKIQEYIFVINDKFKGADKKIIERVHKLGIDHNINAKVLTALNLKNTFYNLSFDKQERLIAKYSISKANRSAIRVAADLISSKLPIDLWKSIDEEIPFFALDETYLNLLSEIRSTLFSIKFSSADSNIIDNLIKCIISFVNLFYADNTTEKNGERAWDNSWKKIFPHPKAKEFDAALIKWHKDIFLASEELCAALNAFARLVRQHELPDFLDHRNYTITRLIDSIKNEFIEYQP